MTAVVVLSALWLVIFFYGERLSLVDLICWLWFDGRVE